MSQRSPFNKRNNPTPEEDGSVARSGMTKKSPSRAKPAREAAAGVRVVKSSGAAKKVSSAPLTKEEKKAKRRAEREEEDQISTISSILMKQDPNFHKYQHIWWALLGVGFAAVIGSFVVGTFAGMYGEVAYDLATPLGISSVVLLVAAYALIIASIVWEFRKIRPLRRDAMRKVQSMTQKRRQAVLENAYEAQERERAEKAAKKAAKK